MPRRIPGRFRLPLWSGLRAACRAGLAILVALVPAGGRAAPVDRTRLDHVLAVLREAPADASDACLGSMRHVHALERRRSGSSDELEFAYQDASQLCGADAERVCRTTTAIRQRDNCKTLDASP